MFEQYKTVFLIGAASIIVLVLASGTWWISGLRAANATYAANENILKSAISEQKLTISQLQEDVKDIKLINNDLISVIEEQQHEIDNLDEKFNTRANGTSRDFGDISRAKPGLINKIINRATNNVNRCTELATGAELKLNEKNKECPELIKRLKALK